MNKIIFTAILILFGSQFLRAQYDWPVPDDQKSRLSPFAFNDSTQEVGHKLYRLNCTSCHGDPGKGNHADLDPIPPDPASEMVQSNLDGELYYKLSQGKGLMPSFKNILTPEQIWFVVSYMRQFNEDYVQEIAKEAERKGYDGVIEILLTWSKDGHLIKSEVVGNKGDGPEPIIGAPIKITAARYFGGFEFDGIKTTDNLGAASFKVPENLPGDSLGYITFSASLADLELYGNTQTDTTLLAGVPTHLPALNSQRAMWNTVWKAPVWLLATYFIGVLAVWGTIFYIIFMMRKIYLINKTEE